MRKPGAITPEETFLLDKTPSRAGPRAAIIFPNAYTVGMANLGFQTVYRDLFLRDDLQVERVFLDNGLRSVESGSSLSSFDVTFFSISFESDVLNVLQMLYESGIPLLSEDRTAHDPFIVAGGIVPTTNSYCLAPFVDLFLHGESEAVLQPFLDLLSEEDLLEKAAALPGAYVPRIHLDEAPPVVPTADFEAMTPAHSIILSKQSEFPNLFLVEISRGCRNCCRFCGVSRLQGRPRYHGADKILSLIERYGERVERVGLVAADVGSNPEFKDICRRIIDSGRGLTTSSVEMTAGDEHLLRLLAEGGQKTLTLAPEAGDETIRRRLAKPISDALILETCRLAAQVGLPSLKLYFLIGLCELFEGLDADQEASAICSLVHRIDEARGRTGSISVNLSPLVPRVGTPISDSPLPGRNTIKRITNRVRHELSRNPNVKVNAGGWFEAASEWLINHGTADLADILEQAVRNPADKRKILTKKIAEILASTE